MLIGVTTLSAATEHPQLRWHAHIMLSIMPGKTSIPQRG